MSRVDEILNGAKETLTVRRVFGEPLEQNGVTVITAAAVRGGGGGGEGVDPESHETGAGGGFGMSARPIGAFRIEGNDVSWVPAADTTKVLIVAEIALIVALLVLRSVLRTRSTA